MRKKLNRTILRTTQVLELLAKYPDGLTLSEISLELDLPKTSAFDIIHTLKQAYYLRESGKRFCIGFKAREIGDAYAQAKDILGIAKSHLPALAEEMAVTVSLVFLENHGLHYALQYRPKAARVDFIASGGREDFHASATGKLFLTYMSKARQEKQLARLSWKPYTPKTVQDHEQLVTELRRIKKQGYAIDIGEFAQFLTCVSAPIFQQKRHVAALTVSGVQIEEKDIPHLAKKIIKVAAAISQDLNRG